MSASIACPHCEKPARVRSSRQVTRTYRQLHLECTNRECGHVFGGGLSVTHTIVPSAVPDPEIHLHMAPRRSANDNPARGPEVPPVAAAANEKPPARSTG